MRQRIARRWFEIEPLIPSARPLDCELVSRQWLATNYVAQIVGEMFNWREAAGLRVQIRKIEAPASGLATAMFACKAI